MLLELIKKHEKNGVLSLTSLNDDKTLSRHRLTTLVAIYLNDREGPTPDQVNGAQAVLFGLLYGATHPRITVR